MALWVKMMSKTYTAYVGCWNCDNQYGINIRKGIIAAQWIMETKPRCTQCGCETLKVHNEYTIEKEIMKDVILHAKIGHMDMMPSNAPPKKEHQHFG